MELINATGMQAGYTLGMDPDGREYVVVVIKGTFSLRRDGSVPVLAEEQAPLVMADEFTGEPGKSATVYESEFPLFKPRCDVILHGSAYAPGGRPATKVEVGLRVGSVDKSFAVIGDRVWEDGGIGARPSAPVPFAAMPISYDRAFGGTDNPTGDPERGAAYLDNPVGVGYYPLSKGKDLLGSPLPNTEETGNPVRAVEGKFRPMSFGPIGRNFQARIPYAGTYDQDWIDNVFPFLPTDFNPLYHQCAPPDQQMEHPRGGEMVELSNLTPAGRVRFPLPPGAVPVEFTDAGYGRTTTAAALDTVIIEPDLERLMLVWRASKALKRNMLEARQAVVGQMSKAWYRARDLGKDYYPSMSALVRSRRGEEE